MNNRKATRGRPIQSILVAEMLIKKGVVVPNPHPKSGKRIQIKHAPTKKYQ